MKTSIASQRNQHTHTRAVTLLLSFVLAITGLLAVASVASANNTGGYPYALYQGPGSNPPGSYWTDVNGNPNSPNGYVYRNCTDYVAWKLKSLGVEDAKVRGLGNGGQWAANAADRAGVTVSNSPTVGSAAVRLASGSDFYGHVAFVEAVNPSGTITVSEYNWVVNGVPDGSFHQKTATAASMGLTKFIDFGVNVSGGGSGSLAVTVGSTLYAKANLGGQWSTLSPGYARDLQVAGDRIAMVDGSGSLLVKQGVGGVWTTQINGFDEYKISSSLLVVRVGSNLYGKAGLNDMWSLLTTGATSDVRVAGDRISFVTGGSLLVKDGIGGQWTTQINGFDEYHVTPSLITVKVGSALYGKANLADGWSTFTTGVTSGYRAEGNRIAYVSGATLMVKDGVNGQWTTQINGFDEYDMSSSALVVRVGSNLYGKIGLGDAWSTLTTGATSGIRVDNDRISFVTGGTLLVKDGIDGQWTTQINGFDEYKIG